jgi:hypothetical protein
MQTGGAASTRKKTTTQNGGDGGTYVRPRRSCSLRHRSFERRPAVGLHRLSDRVLGDRVLSGKVEETNADFETELIENATGSVQKALPQKSDQLTASRPIHTK